MQIINTPAGLRAVALDTRFGSTALHIGNTAHAHQKRIRLAHELKMPIFWLTQIHGNAIATPTTTPNHADALTTTTLEQALAIMTADCLPVLLYGTQNGIPRLSVIHAGWAGLASGIITRALDDFDTVEFAHIGAHICVHCYETDTDFAHRLADKLGAPHDADFLMPKGDKIHINLTRIAQNQLAQKYPYANTPICTACGDDQHSHRCGTDGRNALVAWLE